MVSLRSTKRYLSGIDSMLRSYGLDPQALKAKSEERAKEMGITHIELGLLTLARWKAELSARPDETTKETEARTHQIWLEEKAKFEQEQKQISDLLKNQTPEYRKWLLAEERKKMLAKERRNRQQQ